MSVDAALIASAALMGLAAAPHCAVMCGAPCAAATGAADARKSWAFHGARTFSYVAAGAAAAFSMGAVASLSQLSPAARPLWTALHVAALVWGLWLLWQGRQPLWLTTGQRAPGAASVPVRLVPAAVLSRAAATQPHSQPLPTSSGGVWRATAAGALWVAWPCGMLHSALMVAALTATPVAGALAMGVFAWASAPGLVLAPWLWRRWVAGPTAANRQRLLTRLGGGVLLAASTWALLHGLGPEVAAWCGFD